MGRQLALMPGVPDLQRDVVRTAMRVAGGPRKARSTPDAQPELRPDPSRAKPVDEKALARKWALDLAEYLAEVPGARPEIRSKRHRISAPRLLRAGNRPESLGNGRLTREEKVFVEADVFIADATGERLGPPRTFGECGDGPCAHASCRHSLLIEIGLPRNGKPPSVKNNHPGRDPQELQETCSIRAAMKAAQRKNDPDAIEDVAMSFEEISRLLNLTPERARQLCDGALAKLKKRKPEMREW
jgi:hypothetical protein